AIDPAGLRVASLDGAAVDNVGVQRIGGGIAGFAAGAQRLPVAHGDAGEPPARADAHGAAVLLRAGHPVGKRAVGRETIDLRRRLIQPRRPGRMFGQAVDADYRALVAAENHPITVVRVDPELVIVVAARRSLERLAERAAAVARAIDAG